MYQEMMWLAPFLQNMYSIHFRVQVVDSHSSVIRRSWMDVYMWHAVSMKAELNSLKDNFYEFESFFTFLIWLKMTEKKKLSESFHWLSWSTCKTVHYYGKLVHREVYTFSWRGSHRNIHIPLKKFVLKCTLSARGSHWNVHFQLEVHFEIYTFS